MRKDIFKKGLVLGIMFLFVGAGGIPSVVGNETATEKTIYVDDDSECPGDGTEEWPYCNIQYAIDNASDGDTIFVYSGTYYEHLEVYLTINLMGEDKNTTIIDGGEKETVVNVSANGVEISSLTIRNGRLGIYSEYDVNILWNIVENNEYGILLRELPVDHNTDISYNIITSNDYGIHFAKAYNINILANNIRDNRLYGVLITTKSEDCFIEYNNFTDNGIGIELRHSSINNKIYLNNFINNHENHAWVKSCSTNSWRENYWDNWIGITLRSLKMLPKIIWGWYGPIPWPAFDIYPQSEPIPGICP